MVVWDPIDLIRRAPTGANQQGRSLREEMRRLVLCHFFGAQDRHILIRQDASMSCMRAHSFASESAKKLRKALFFPMRT